PHDPLDRHGVVAAEPVAPAHGVHEAGVSPDQVAPRRAVPRPGGVEDALRHARDDITRGVARREAPNHPRLHAPNRTLRVSSPTDRWEAAARPDPAPAPAPTPTRPGPAPDATRCSAPGRRRSNRALHLI